MNKEQAPSLRWAVRHCTPNSPGHDYWGDIFFAEALCAALERHGQESVPYRHGVLPSSDSVDVNLVLRGRYREPPMPHKINLLWIISYPERVTTDEINDYDLVFAASNTLCTKLSELSQKRVYPLLEATDPNLFNTQRGSIKYRHPLFVGSTCIEDDGSRRHRPIIEMALATGTRIDVIGNRWTDEFPPEWLISEFVDYSETACHYRGAPITFADHYRSMAQEGIFQARLFDAVASGARVVSDYVEGVEELFRGAVKTWKTADEFAYLCSAEGRSKFPSDEEMASIAKYVQETHSFDCRAGALMDAVAAFCPTLPSCGISLKAKRMNGTNPQPDYPDL